MKSIPLTDKPTAEQTAWIFKMICENRIKGGSFRYLIYDKMGYSPDDYELLYNAGGMIINNIMITGKADEYYTFN